MVDTIIELRQVNKTYETPAGKVTVLKDIDLHVASSEFVTIVGNSGSGKTTLVKLLLGFYQPQN